MEQKTVDEIYRVECHEFLLITICGIPPSEGHLTIPHRAVRQGIGLGCAAPQGKKLNVGRIPRFVP